MPVSNAMTSTSAIFAERISLQHGSLLAISEVSFSLEKGRMLGVIGPNGAGKSSLLSALLGLSKSTKGRVLFDGMPLKKRRKQVAFIPQKSDIDWSFPITLYDAVMMGRYGHLGWLKWYRKRDREHVDHILEELDLIHLAKRHISALSGGQQQRLFLARALVQEADILIFDEPFAGVDQGTEEEIVQRLHALQKEKKTVVVVHHGLDRVPDYFDRVLMINRVQIAFGPTASTFTPENLNKTFGRHSHLLFEAMQLAKRNQA
ncbi:MAG: metal ABC transporter ATP-binding protein [Chlamydiota bacterium]|nr:metal ABC transporter ATP-binding protein [Chlamydiota bacterium]